MTKLIGLLIIVVVCWGGYELFEMWDKYDSSKDIAEKKAEADRNFNPDGLPGMPFDLQKSFETARAHGAPGMKAWLKANVQKVEDPRRAWIELDYAVMISKDDPNEAKKIYESVKDRTATNSPVFPRIEQLKRTYE